MRVLAFLAMLSFSATSALAAGEPSGCDKFKWPIERERAALSAPDRAQLASGSEQAVLPSSAITLGLVTPGEARLPAPPERAPKGGTFAGFTSVKSAKAGLYTISLSIGAWIDVVQDGHVLKPVAFSGATDCSGIRKTVKYELSSQPFVLQVSGAKENSIAIAILPVQ
ncbi:MULTISPECIES: hypothetical protein [Bradyrhizobium]|uniref:Uncharacterized protein n=1 Tax=Bradyrhizobium nanningense TaxID=1325118 RepID=A0A4Q0S083_9BRAD|nr:MULTISPECIES: hypothetical protein [Bradyrhizobium]RXH21449.1 hypothetical protein XH84_37710 [Bradyrhizobium nanningense]RXH25754.1 hypothetical protein XH99_23435 [Bradyrhizobium nanningense]TQF34558.1 hypothetical protein UNPA324_25010 [Bradyrhizobium sp. UNPA324]